MKEQFERIRLESPFPLFWNREASLPNVGSQAYFRSLVKIAVSAALVMGSVVPAQESSLPQQAPSAATQTYQEEIQKNAAVPCFEPPPMVGWQDYQGKFGKVGGMFARKLERKAVHVPHYKPGAVLCTLEPKDKFLLFVHSTVDPVTFVNVAYDAGIGQAENSDPGFGQGAAGYGKRFGAGFAGQASSEFFKDFAYPTVFSEDPRYYRLVRAGKGKRLLHAAAHVFIAHREDGTHMFNFSEWLGTSSAVALSNVYHPDYERGFSPAAQRVGYSVLSDSGFDVLREFWPEIARKLKLPFRGQHELSSQGSSPK
jgi:hypothetical protein